jgi:hypothetical protein
MRVKLRFNQYPEGSILDAPEGRLWSAAAKLPPSLFGLFKAAASRPHSKGFASNYAALIEMQSCVSRTVFPIEFIGSA